MRREERNRALQKWRERLEAEFAHKRVVEAILPNFEAWLRRSDRVTYRLTQILTGHGCFGEYLNRIGREVTPRCHHCGDDRDTAQHTLEDCPEWLGERRVLVEVIGHNLCLPTVISAMLTDPRAWQAVVTFCETVMFQKEAAERDRERMDPTRRQRRRGTNRRRI